MLFNLVCNAIKFTDEGAIFLEIDFLQNKQVVDDSCFEPAPFDSDQEGIFEKNAKLLQMDEQNVGVKAGNSFA